MSEPKRFATGLQSMLFLKTQRRARAYKTGKAKFGTALRWL